MEGLSCGCFHETLKVRVLVRRCFHGLQRTSAGNLPSEKAGGFPGSSIKI